MKNVIGFTVGAAMVLAMVGTVACSKDKGPQGPDPDIVFQIDTTVSYVGDTLDKIVITRRLGVVDSTEIVVSSFEEQGTPVKRSKYFALFMGKWSLCANNNVYFDYSWDPYINGGMTLPGQGPVPENNNGVTTDYIIIDTNFTASARATSLYFTHKDRKYCYHITQQGSPSEVQPYWERFIDTTVSADTHKFKLRGSRFFFYWDKLCSMIEDTTYIKEWRSETAPNPNVVAFANGSVPYPATDTVMGSWSTTVGYWRGNPAYVEVELKENTSGKDRKLIFCVWNDIKSAFVPNFFTVTQRSKR